MADEDLPPEGEDAGVIDAPEIDEAEPQEQTPPSLDDLASEMGWTPKDQWRGDPEKWRPAQDFIKHTVDINSSLKSKLDAVEKTVGNMARTSAQITQQAVERERERLANEQQEAFEVGDAAAFNKAQQELARLPQVVAPEVSAAVNSFKEKNTWFGEDQEATNWAARRTDELAAQGFSEARQLAIVEREVKQFFPELVPEPARGAPLNRPGARGGTSAAKGFSSLPKDAQEAALEYEKRGVCTRHEYAKTYYEEA